jgi:hypothetical protein
MSGARWRKAERIGSTSTAAAKPELTPGQPSDPRHAAHPPLSFRPRSRSSSRDPALWLDATAWAPKNSPAAVAFKRLRYATLLP